MAQLTSMMVRALRGAPITVLVLLILERKPMEMELIRRHTGYSQDTIHEVVGVLSEYGLINQVGRYSWQAMIGAEQLALGEEEKLDAENAEGAEEEIRSGNIGAGCLESSGGYIDIKPRENLLPESRGDSSGKTRAEPDVGVLEACDDCGIEEPARSRLARLRQVSAELVRKHCAEAPTIGAAIWRLEHGWRGRRSAKDQENNDRRKYVDGPFADFITH